MIRLRLQRGPEWLELLPGIAILVRPPSSSLIAEARADDAVRFLSEDAPRELVGLAFAKALARRVILEWRGVEDEAGRLADPAPETIDALLEVFPVYQAFEERYLKGAMVLDAEKNASGPSLPGTSATDPATAETAPSAVPSAPTT